MIAALAFTAVAAGPAGAFDFFGLFGSDTPPPVRADTLAYAMTVEAKGQDRDDPSDAEQTLRDASMTYALRHDAPPDGMGLLRRLQADMAPLTDALWALGYYDGHLDVLIDGIPADLDETAIERSARRADAFRGKSVVAIKIVATLGPLFRLRRVQVAYPPKDAPDGLPRLAFRLRSGDPARSADLRAAQLRLVDWFRARGHPLARIADVRASVDHAGGTMDLDIVLDPKAKAGFGPVSVSAANGLGPAVASHVYIAQGDPYAPDRIAATKKSIARIPAAGGIRIREADALDADGNLPIFIDVTERPLHLLGATARYSTKDGPGITAYWQDRDLFGGGESLRIEGDVSLLERIDGTQYDGFSNLKPSDFGARIGASFIKPALFGSRNDLLVDASANRMRVGDNAYGGYTARAVGGTIGVIHRFSDSISAQAGLQGKQSVSSDVLGRVDATLVGLTAAARYDTTDNPLDPTRGMRATGTLDVYPRAVGSTIDLVAARGAGSAYYAIDDDANYVVAGRLAVGSLAGAPLGAIPSEERFYSGGGGSVRGFTFGTISPLVSHQITGGRSLLEGAAELRVRITPTIGVVPFIDAGGAFRSRIPDFRDYVGVGAGLGLRYLTPIGPIRFDVATPVNRRPGDGIVAIYVSIGQAF